MEKNNGVDARHNPGFQAKNRKRSGRRKSKKLITKVKKRGKSPTFLVSGWIAVAVVVVLLALTFVFRPLSFDRETGDKVPPKSYEYAIDLSHHNGNTIVWDSLRVMTDAGRRTTKSISKAVEIRNVSYVILKATEGISLKDKKFNAWWKAAGKGGYKRGAYHFFRSSKDPEVQARKYIKMVGKLKDNDLPPILDIETMHTGCTKKALNDNALIWLKTVEEHYGRTPIVYSSESFIKDNLDDRIRKNYPLWIAHYKVRSIKQEDWALWQFTDKAVVYGIDGYVDLNAVNPEIEL